MSNLEPITNFKTKKQKDNSSTSDLRDPNIIFPTSRKESDFTTVSEIIDNQKKISPIMLRSFNKDLSEAMDKKKDSVSISAKERKTNQISVATKAEIDSLKSSLNSGKEGAFLSSLSSSPKIFGTPKIEEAINKKAKDSIPPKVLDLKVESPIAFRKAPEAPRVTALEKGNAPIPKIPPTAPQNVAFKGDIPKAIDAIKEIVHTEKIILPKKEVKDFSSEIFPRPPQLKNPKQQEPVKKAILQEPVNEVMEDAEKKQKLRDVFDCMIFGGDEGGEFSQPKPQPKTNTVTNVSNPNSDIEKKNNDEDNLILPKENNYIHISGDDLKKLKEDILSAVAKEKELQSKIQALSKQEIDLTEEENKAESEKIKIKEQLDDVLEQERKIESSIHSFEEQEKGTTDLEKLHNIEKERWSQEEKRTQIEKNKWNLNEKYEKILTLLKEKNNKLEQIKNFKDTFNREAFSLMEEKKQKETKICLGEIEQERIEIEKTQMDFLEEKKNIDKTLDLLKNNRQKVLEEKQIAEENEQKAEALSEKRIFEEKRQNIEIRQRSIEQQTWEAKQKLEKIMEDLKKTNESYKVVISKETEVRGKL